MKQESLPRDVTISRGTVTFNNAVPIGGIEIYKKNGIVYCLISVSYSSEIPVNTPLFTIPLEYIPNTTYFINAYNDGSLVQIEVSSLTGVATLARGASLPIPSGSWIIASVTWLANE